ncbi:hypothetical protein FACHB389_36245 [Nostoc calcicola FACHB-389]|nr:hypothetical protein FACHB389_36245 [Nostoc calcicola FACHB-389]
MAATLPLPIQQNSRRRHIQRFLTLNALSVVLLWFPIIEAIINQQHSGKKINRTEKRHSNFWIGLYGFNWIEALHGCQAWVEEMVGFIRNKQAYDQQGLRAMTLIQQSL